MKALSLAIIAAMCLWISVAKADPSSDAVVAEEGAFMNAVKTARNAWIAASANKAQAVEFASAIAKLELKPDNHGYYACEYVRCRLLVLAAQDDKAQILFVNMLNERAVAPEALLGLVELNKDHRQKRFALEDALAQLLPLSVWRSGSDGRQSGGGGVLSDPPPPIIPKLERNVLIGIAKECEQAGLFDVAWKAYIEAIYGGLAPSWIADPPREAGWFSSDSAELWARAADNAWKSGEHRLAYEYLAKAVIFGSEAQVDSAKDTLKIWAQQNEKKTEISKEQRRQALEIIVKLYAEINAHPRALEVIQEYKAWLDRPDALYEEYAKEWRAVVKSYSRVTKNVVLYGTKLSGNVDPITIKVPFACAEESLKAAKGTVISILEKTDGNLPEGSTTKPNKSGN